MVRFLAIVMLGSLLACVQSSLAQCGMDWSRDFGPLGLGGYRLEPEAAALLAFDDGSGRALYVGGYFEAAGSVVTRGIVRWDGACWSTLAAGLNDRVNALCNFDDGTGPALYAAGDILGGGVKNVARWDGTEWRRVGKAPNWDVYALAVFDDGTGPALYAGGVFDEAGGEKARCIAKWDGANWSALGSGMFHYDWEPAVRSLAVFDDGNGPALYAGGHFTKAGGVEAINIAKWDGESWSAVGYGVMGGFSDGVFAMTMYDDGAGPALYAGGQFEYAGLVEANGIARWDGSEWSTLGSGIGKEYDSIVQALTVFDDGTGTALYAGGRFDGAGGVEAHRVARWDGQEWSALSTGVDGYVYTLAVFDDGEGPGLYLGGEFEVAGDVGASRIAMWDGRRFRFLGDGNGASAEMNCFMEFDAGDGPALYASGSFRSCGGTGTNRIARWDGAAWQPVGGGVTAGIWGDGMTVFDDGRGAALYLGGKFWIVGDVEARNIARWDGASWEALSGGVGDRFGSSIALTQYDDGNGPALYVGGEFVKASGATVNNIARWDGSEWSALGSGLTVGRERAVVIALAVFDDGAGPALYAGGLFDTAGGERAWGIAKWDGEAWSEVGGGVSEPYYGYPGVVAALCVFDDGSGPALYVGGGFTRAGDLPADGLARWDGREWTNVGDWFDSGDERSVNGVMGLAVFDDGTGPALYVGGYFNTGNVEAEGVARWDGQRWSALGSGLLGGATWAMRGFDDGSGPALWVGGDFLTAGGRPSSNIARWGPRVRGDMNCDGRVDADDVDAFVAALIGRAVYEERYGDCDFARADISCDGDVNFDDIDGFVECLMSGGCP